MTISNPITNMPTLSGGSASPTFSANASPQQYMQMRSDYLQDSQPVSRRPMQGPISDARGFFKSGGGADMSFLLGRYAGFDKLFYSLINNVVEDPDFALRKDPDVYRRMLRDPQIYYCLEVRKSASTALPWMIAPPDAYAKDPNALKAATDAERRIKRIPSFTQLLSHIMDAMLPGLSVNELVWAYEDMVDAYIVKHHFPVNKDRFKFTREGRLQLLQPLAPYTGAPLPPYKFIHHTFNIADGSWMRPEDAGYVYFGRGLADTPLYHYFYFKVCTLRLLVKALERHAGPLKIFYSGPQNTLQMNTMSAIMSALQNDSVVAIPGKKGEIDVDIPRAGGNGASGAAPLYIEFIEYVDKLITRAILGQELMTEMPSSGSGSYALGSVHQSVFAQLTSSDRDQLRYTVNASLMKFDAELNTPQLPVEMRPEFKFRQGAVADTGIFLQTVQLAVDLGIAVSEVQVREATGLREPLEDEGVISRESLFQQQLQQQMQQQAAMPQPQLATNNKEEATAKEQ